MRLRQVALVARDCEPVVEDLCTVLGLEVCYHDPDVGVFGLRNALLPVGPDAFLEVVAPVRADTAAGRRLARLGGPGGYMVIVQTDDLHAARARVTALGVRIVWEIALEDAATIHLHPSDVGGALLSIDAMSPPGSWRWAGPAWQRHVRTELTRELLGVTLAVRDPAAVATRWAGVLGCAAETTRDGQRAITLAPGTLRFVPCPAEEPERLAGITLRVADPSRVHARARDRGLPAHTHGVRIAGVDFDLVA